MSDRKNGEKLLRYVNGRSCTLLGLGVSNLPLARMLLDAGIELTVADKKSPCELGEAALALQADGARFVSGEACFDRIDGELIFRSPGIRPDINGIERAIDRGAELTSEMELFLSLTDARTFAITGSDGKTTSTTLTGKFLEAHAKRHGAGNVYVGGNIGKPLLTLCSEMDSSASAVLELSSFQLMTLKDAPAYCAITNLSPNHLDWHRGMEEYEAAKRHVIGERTKRVVLNAESEATARIAVEELSLSKREVFLFSSRRKSLFEFSEFFNTLGASEGRLRSIYERNGVIVISDGEREEELLRVSDVLLPGRHNIENYMTAMALTYGQVDKDIYTDIARTFGGVEHRLELVRTLDGVDYYNSSIDSSPSRTAAALSALSGRDIVIICGGYDKKIPFEPLARSLCESVRAVVLTGATARKIREAIESFPEYDPEVLALIEKPCFEDAVLAARSLARRGGCVLLSPACASFDAFKNFAERGETFKKIVRGYEPCGRNDTEN